MKKVPTTNVRSTPRSRAPAKQSRARMESEERSSGRPSQRADILEAAVDLFAKGGSRGTPMAAIAERIGVSIPAITHHFGSKNGLFMEVIAVSDSIDELRTTRREAKDGIDRLSAVRFWAHELASDSALANLSRLTLVMTVEALDADFAAHEHFVVRHRRFRSLIAKTLRDGQQDGSIKKDIDPDLMAIEIMGFVQGSVLQWHLDSDEIDLVLVFDNYFDRLVDAVASATATTPKPAPRVKKKAVKRPPATSTRRAKRT
jgi:AcrR family transcriptional regulator